MNNKKLSLILILLLVLIILPLGHIQAQNESPGIDGLIAYIGEDHNVWVRYSDNLEGVQITQDADQNDHYISPRFSPDGSMLAYCKLVDRQPNNARLYVTRIGDWQPLLIAEKMRCFDWPSLSYDWSPDSSSILYTRPFSDNSQSFNEQWASYDGIWIAEINTGAISEFIPPPSTNPLINPQWAPDGTWVKLYEFSIKGSRGNLLTGDNQSGTLYSWFGASNIWPGGSDWSPDSTKIVFDEIAYTGFVGAGIYLASPNGENITRIYSNPSQMPRYPIWSPDNQSIAFQVNIPDHHPALILVKPDGSNPINVHTGFNRILPVTWDPSGRQLLFATIVDGYLTQFLYDLDAGTTTTIGKAGAWGADWSIGLVDPGIQIDPVVYPGFPYSESLMLYVSPDRRLVLYNPGDGRQLDLTEPYSVTSFFPSPSGHRLIYGRQLITLQFQDNEELVVASSLLPASPVGSEVSWSKDENQLAYRDWRGNVWIADLIGKAEKIPGAVTIPDWSSDGEWVSYCTEDKTLWVVGSSNPPVELAKNSTCDSLWSPNKNILAYTAYRSPAGETTYVSLFDVSRMQSSLVHADAEIISWAPDGNLLALQSSTQKPGAGAKLPVYLSTADGERLLEIENFSTQSPDKYHWVTTDSEYIFGSYRLSPDLSDFSKFTDQVIASSEAGRLLVSNQELGLDILSCLDPATGNQSRLLTVDLSQIPSESLPGIWGWMSPDGSQAITRTYLDGEYVTTLHDCDNPAQTTLPFGEFPEEGVFSEDGRFYYIARTSDGDPNQVLVYSLQSNQVERIPALTDHNAVWLDDIEYTGIHTVEGRVKTADGSPLDNASVFIDGILVTTTDDTGSYSIIRLTPGEHIISLQKTGYTFSPQSYSITVPPDTDSVDFRASSDGSPDRSEAPFLGQTSNPDTSPTADSQEPDSRSTLDRIISTVLSFIEWLVSFVLTNIKQLVLPGLYAIPSVMDNPSNQLLLGIICLGLVGIIVLSALLVSNQKAKKRTQAIAPESGVPADQPPATEHLPAGTEPAPPDIASPPAAEVKPSEERVSDEQISIILKSGIALVRDGDYATGEQMFRKVIAYKPEEPKAWLWLGYLLGRKKEYRAAERCFKLAQKYGHPKADEALIWLNAQKS